MVCIITFARSWQALIATRALGRNGINVVTADTDEYATAFFSKYSLEHFLYTSPEVNEKKFIKELIQKAKYYKKKYNEDVMILPVFRETYIISKYKKELSRYAKLCIDDYSRIKKVHNKGSLSVLVKKHKIKSPKTYLIKDILQLYSIVPKMKFPVFIKLKESVASIGLKKVDTRDDLIYEYKNMVHKYKHYPIIQESVPGGDYCVTAILNRGKLRAMMTYESIKQLPYKSGPGVYRKNANVPTVEKEAKKFLKAIKWHGLIELDFRMSSDKKPYLIEANPRFWGGLNQSVASNVNYPLLAYDIAMKGDCEKVTKLKKNVRTENLFAAVLALMDEIKNNERKREELNRLKSYWKKAFRSKQDFSKNMNLFFRQLQSLDKRRYSTLSEFVKRRKLVKDDIFDREDPFVVRGIFYPIHIMLKYGKINKSILLGTEIVKKK